MRALVVYESMFGGTRRMAEAIAEGMRPHLDVSLVRVGEAALMVVTDLLVIGAPTHAGRLSSPASREEAAAWAAEPDRNLVLERGARGMGVREWLDDVEQPIPLFAAFDTRANAARIMTGSAAVHIDRQLRKLGAVALVEPVSFLVHENNVLEHEAERATEWGARLAASVMAASAAVAS